MPLPNIQMNDRVNRKEMIEPVVAGMRDILIKMVLNDDGLKEVVRVDFPVESIVKRLKETFTMMEQNRLFEKGHIFKMVFTVENGFGSFYICTTSMNQPVEQWWCLRTD